MRRIYKFNPIQPHSTRSSTSPSHFLLHFASFSLIFLAFCNIFAFGRNSALPDDDFAPPDADFAASGTNSDASDTDFGAPDANFAASEADVDASDDDFIVSHAYFAASSADLGC